MLFCKALTWQRPNPPRLKDSDFGVTAGALSEILQKLDEAKAKAKDLSAAHTDAQKAACTRLGFDKKAFAILRRIDALDDGERDELLRSLFKLIELRGWLDQGDLFDDTKEKLQVIAKKAGEKTSNVKAKILGNAA